MNRYELVDEKTYKTITTIETNIEIEEKDRIDTFFGEVFEVSDKLELENGIIELKVFKI